VLTSSAQRQKMWTKWRWALALGVQKCESTGAQCWLWCSMLEIAILVFFFFLI